MEIFDGTVNRDPVVPLGVASKQYVDTQVQNGVGVLVVGQVYIVDVIPATTGIVSSKQYVPNTVPANVVISEVSSDTSSVRIQIYAEGGSAFFSPVILVNGVQATLTKIPVAGDFDASRVYTGFANITIANTGDTVVTAISDTGANSTITIHRLGLGPVVQNILIGSLPGSQTTAKHLDVVGVSGVVANTGTYAEVISGGAANALSPLTIGAADSGGAGFKTVAGNFAVSNLTGPQSITVRAKNTFGTFGAGVQSSNSITLDQTYPTVGAISVSYPVGQGALKGSETATVSSAITNANVYAYSSSANLSIGLPGSYSISKVATRTGGGYINSGTNYTISATRTSNAATTVLSALVKIADTSPTAAITISGNPAYLSSSPTGTNYTITITADQVLNIPPSLNASGGTWVGSWAGSGTTWWRVLNIKDSDVRGSHTFSSLSMVNIANVNGSVISSGANYIIGGFSLRSIVFSPFSQFEPIGLPVTDITKVVVQYEGINVNLVQRNDTVTFVNGFTIVDSGGIYSPVGSYLFLTDSDFTGGNTTGTLTVNISEVA